MLSPVILDPAASLLLVVDVQQKLAPHIADSAGNITQIARLIRAAATLALPVVVTEQNPAGLGGTVAELVQHLPANSVRLEKSAFSCFGDARFRAWLAACGRSQVIVTGIEAHVCVQKTVLELLGAGYVSFVAADAVGSRRVLDRDMAVARMRDAGAIVTTAESVIFELLTDYTDPRFRDILRIVK